MQVGFQRPEDYWQWVHTPVPGAPRFFRSSLLEHCTKTPWWVVPALWGPLWLAAAARAVAAALPVMPWAGLAAFAAGLLSWQALECAPLPATVSLTEVISYELRLVERL